MRYKTPLILVCASLALLASATPQANSATDAVAKSTKTMTKTAVATAQVGDADPAAATGAAAANADMDSSTETGTNSDSDSDSVAGTDTGTSDSIVGKTSGSGSGPGSAANNVGAGTRSSDASSGSSYGNSAPPPPGGSDSNAGDYSSANGGGGNGPPADFKGKGGLGGQDWSEFKGKMPSGDMSQVWSKFAGGNGHPHQPVARGWSDWIKGYGGNGAKSVQNGGDRHLAARRLPGGDQNGGGKMRDGLQGAHHFHARDEIVRSGPSWSLVRSGGVRSVKVARGMAYDGTVKEGDGKGYGKQ